MSRVLLVDDDPVLLEVLATVLQLERFEVSTASDGHAALAAAQADLPDVVVCDVTMPGLDGLEVCRQLKASPRTATVPVVLLTVRGSVRDKAAGAAAGCDAYLTKPFEPGEFVELLRQLTTGSEVGARTTGEPA